MSDFSNPNSLIINFIRDLKQYGKDDAVYILPEGQFYKVTYRDTTVGSRNSSIVTEHELYDFVENLITLLPVDEDPFNYFQITAPTFPPILLKTSNLNKDEISEAVGNVIRSTIRNWPRLIASRRPVTRSMTQSLA